MQNSITTKRNYQRQLSFKSLPKVSKEYGGAINKGKRKVARPFDSKKPLHVTLRSLKARGRYSLLNIQNKVWIEKLVRALGQKWNVRIQEYANSGNHLHIAVYARSRSDFQAFLRILAGQVSMHVWGGKKGDANGKFWDSIPYTRIVSWGRELLKVRKYIVLNNLESRVKVRGADGRSKNLKRGSAEIDKMLEEFWLAFREPWQI